MAKKGEGCEVVRVTDNEKTYKGEERVWVKSLWCKGHNKSVCTKRVIFCFVSVLQMSPGF